MEGNTCGPLRAEQFLGIGVLAVLCFEGAEGSSRGAGSLCLLDNVRHRSLHMVVGSSRNTLTAQNIHSEDVNYMGNCTNPTRL